MRSLPPPPTQISFFIPHHHARPMGACSSLAGAGADPLSTMPLQACALGVRVNSRCGRTRNPRKSRPQNSSLGDPPDGGERILVGLVPDRIQQCKNEYRTNSTDCQELFSEKILLKYQCDPTSPRRYTTAHIRSRHSQVLPTWSFARMRFSGSGRKSAGPCLPAKPPQSRRRN